MVEGLLRQVRITLLLLVALLLTSPGSSARAAPQGPGENGTEFVNVVPSEDLHGHQAVTVSATGFPPGRPLAIVECTLIESAQGDCDLSTVKLNLVSDAHGKLTPTPFVVLATIRVANKPGPVMCGTGQCAVSVGTLDGFFGGEHCIGFGGPCKPAPPPSPSPSPSVSASPTRMPPAPSPGPSHRASGPGSAGHSNAGLLVAIIVGAVVVLGTAAYWVARGRARSQAGR